MKTVVELIGRIQDGGAETLIKDYALLLDKKEFRTVIVCDFAVKKSATYKILKDNNVEIVELYGKFTTVYRILSRLFGRRLNASLFKKRIKDINPDIIHAHLECLETLYNARDSLNGIKLFYTCHNLPETLIGNIAPKERDAARYLIDHNDLKVIALHEDMAEEIENRFDIDNVEVIRNGIDFKRYEDIKMSKEEIRKNIGIDEDAYVLGYVGRLSYQKNPEFVVDVFNEILKTNKKAVLLIVGNGKLEKDIKKKVSNLGINDNVIMLSHRDDVPELMKAMDVFVFPSRYEGLGIVLIEAQVSELPCVVSENIPKEAFQSNLITVLSLDDSLQNWSDACLDPQCNIDEYGDINDYDMNKEIIKLEKLYLSA